MEIKNIRELSGLNVRQYTERYKIPYTTFHDWDTGKSNTSAEKAYWYAVCFDKEYWDCGTGSYNLEEAKKMLRAIREDYPDAGYIVVVDNHDGDDFVVDTIKEI